MMRNTLQAAAAALFLFAAAPGALYSKRNVEGALGMDGAGRLETHGILRWGKWAVGIGARLPLFFDGEGAEGSEGAGGWAAGVRAAGGVNSPWLTLGSLSAGGLAAEVRNPGYAGLSRLGERTMYRANIRAVSMRKFGIALHHPGGRYGGGWEKRKSGEYFNAWAVPLALESLSAELFIEGGLSYSSRGDKRWYPRIQPRPGGRIGIAGLRVRGDAGRWKWGFTALGSAGRLYRPGVMGSGSLTWTKAAWRFRLRAGWGSDFFRNADGRRVSASRGAAADAHYRPASGLQAALGWRLPFAGVPGTRMESGGARAVLGWRFDRLSLGVEARWNRIMLIPDAGAPVLSLIAAELDLGAASGLRIRWTWKYPGAGLSDSPRSPGAQAVHLTARLRAGRFQRWKLISKLRWNAEHTLLDIGMRWYIDAAPHRLSLALSFGDIPRDWGRGPSGAGDFRVTVTWAVKLD